jgi:hypothetical protein
VKGVKGGHHCIWHAREEMYSGRKFTQEYTGSKRAERGERVGHARPGASRKQRAAYELRGSVGAPLSRSAALLGNEAEPGGRGNGVVGEKEKK